MIQTDQTDQRSLEHSTIDTMSSQGIGEYHQKGVGLQHSFRPFPSEGFVMSPETALYIIVPVGFVFLVITIVLLVLLTALILWYGTRFAFACMETYI